MAFAADLAATHAPTQPHVTASVGTAVQGDSFLGSHTFLVHR